MADDKPTSETTVVRDKKDMMYDQSEVNYTTLSQAKGKACANCRFFFPMGACLITESMPLPILATGYCDEWTETPPPENAQEELIEVLEAIESGIGNVSSSIGYMEAKTTPKKSLKERLMAIMGYKEQPKARDEPFGGFKSIGNGKWIGWYSNNIEDREKDFFPNAGIDAFIGRADKGVSDMPTLRYWHVPVDLGKAKALARFSLDDSPDSPSFIFAVGEYDHTPIARAFEKGTQGKNFKMSHGFIYPESAYIDGVYHVFDTFELSILPPYAAANPYTLFGDDTPMPVLDDNKRKELVGILGEDLIRDFEQKADSRLKELKEQGVKHKDFPLVDSVAREGLSEVKSAVTDLATSIKELVTEMKAAKPADDKKKADEGDDAEKTDKMDKLFGGKKKELDDALAAAKTLTADLEAKVKAFNELTPRQGSKDNSTLIDPTNPQFATFRQQMEQGGASENEKAFKQIYGAAFGANGNGG